MNSESVGPGECNISRELSTLVGLELILSSCSNVPFWVVPSDQLPRNINQLTVLSYK